MNEKEKPAELYPGHVADLAKRAKTIENLDRAHSAMLPGPLRDAFAGQPPKVEGLTLQPVNLSMTINLEAISSPLLDIVRIYRETIRDLSNNEQSKASGAATAAIIAEVTKRVSALKYQEEQIPETILIFTQPQKRIRKLLEAGRDKLREAAMEEIADKFHPAQVATLQQACAQHYVASFATVIGYGSPPPEGGGINFPQASPRKVTGSDGGSNSTPHSDTTST